MTRRYPPANSLLYRFAGLTQFGEPIAFRMTGTQRSTTPEIAGACRTSPPSCTVEITSAIETRVWLRIEDKLIDLTDTAHPAHDFWARVEAPIER